MRDRGERCPKSPTGEHRWYTRWLTGNPWQKSYSIEVCRYCGSQRAEA